MSDYGTEAEHLAEMYDDYDSEDFMPYTRAQRADYVRAKNNRFRKIDIGKYVVTQMPRKNRGVVKRLYLVNRSYTRSFWWSPDANFAMLFEKKVGSRVPGQALSVQQSEGYEDRTIYGRPKRI